MNERGDTNEFLAAIVASSDDAIIGKDLDGTIRSLNPAAERMFGYTASELIGQSVRRLIPEERQHEEMDIIARISRGEPIGHFETVRVTKTGAPVEVSLSISPIRNAEGTVVGAAKIARDVTERNRTRRLLAQQQEWFRVTLGSIGDAVIACDQEGRVSFMNTVAERLTGWPALDAIGRALSDVFSIVSEVTRARVENPTDKVLREGTVQGLANHTLLVARDGTERPIADSAAPIRLDDGTPIGAILVFHDVTEERRAEHALTREREWLRTTLESIGDAVIATDDKGRIAFMNPVAAALTGVSIEDARGMACTDVFRIFNEFTRQIATSPVERVLREGGIVALANHTVLIAADGTERPIDDSGAPIRDHDGRVAGVVLVFRDVTERRRMDNDRLATMAEREQLLESERAARREAERANRVKDDFVATVSHELRTPLNAILGWTEMLRLAPSDPGTVQKAIEVIGRNTRVQAQLVSDLLDLSRIVAGKMTIDPEDLDLAKVVQNAVQTVEPSAKAKSITIDVQTEPGLPLVSGDPDRLQQVLWNLLTNAVKFTPEGGTVRVTTRQHAGNAEIVVADTGAGISPTLIPSVFERFRQGDSPTTRRFGGLGIGLSIVKHLIELHRGSIRAESPGEGKGATFTVCLPLAGRIAERRADSPGASSAGALLDSSLLSNIHVLVVEDDTDTQQMIKRLLESRGAKVSTAANVPDAINALAQTPDLLLCDIGLPEMDGYQLIREVRAGKPPTNRIPAIALTAFARTEDRNRALLSGFQSHMAKPVEPAELMATMAGFAELINQERRK